jgi:hypothetical protein
MKNWGITLEFRQGGAIIAHGDGEPVQVGTFGPDEPAWDGNRGWKAVMWQIADTAPEPGVNNGRVAGLRYGDDRVRLEASLRVALSYGPWWLAKAVRP